MNIKTERMCEDMVVAYWKIGFAVPYQTITQQTNLSASTAPIQQRLRSTPL